MKLKTLDITQMTPQTRQKVNHFSDPRNIIIRRTEKLKQALNRVLPQNPGTRQILGQLSKTAIRSRKSLPELTQGNTYVKKIQESRFGGGF